MPPADVRGAVWRRLAGLALVRRLAGLGILFSLELIAITVSLDNDQIAGRSGLLGWCHDYGPLLLRGVVVFATLLLTFACLRFSSSLVDISRRLSGSEIGRLALAGHAAALGLFAWLAELLYRGGAVRDSNLLAAVWLATGVCAIAMGATAFIRPAFWWGMLRSTGYLAPLALGGALAAAFGGNAMRLLWPRATALTFSLVSLLLRPFGGFSGDPATMSIGSQRFTVQIAPTCSGLEGMGLILAFTIVWLVLFRAECRFPQALILLPLGVMILFLLNSARIAALILIGNAGFPAIALGGFHSQAGWIGFNAVALGTSVAARESAWISNRKPRAVAQPAASVSNRNAVWVMPFVAILAAGMLSRALTGGFEWTYPLRFAAAGGAILLYRREYAALDWRIDWTGPAAGLAVFALWMSLEQSGPGPMPRELAAAPAGLRDGWLLLRVLAATVTVPIAEELAFRGYLLRRFQAAEFEAVSFRAFSWSALAGSSVIFGLLHGPRWIAGTLAGVIFALVVQRRGRLGNAVVAHAVANALLAAEVLVHHRWDLW